jgi:elongation factor P
LTAESRDDARDRQHHRGREHVKVSASSLRKGAVVDLEGKLYVVLSAQNIHGVKISERYRTTETVERAIVDDRPYTFLYEDGEGFHFMNPESYDQVVASQDVVGDSAPYLTDGVQVMLSTHEGVPIALELPRLATFEVVETEPSVKGQTASSSYKPAVLSNGVKTMVPPYIAVGTRIVILTEDASYQERAKD